MVVLIVWLWISSFGLLDFDLAPLVQKVSFPLHQWCLTQIPRQSQWTDLYGAIVCGANPPPSTEKQWFQITGLYHLLVVSGSHLIFLSQWLKPWAQNSRLRFFVVPILTFYALICMGSPPVVRALLQITLFMLPLQSRFGWSAPQISLVTGTLCLTVFPSWSASLSFWLSWLASMLCSWVERLKIHPLARIAVMQTMLTPAFGLANSNLGVSILGNWLLGPILGKYLFGFALLATIFSSMTFLCDLFWEVLVKLLAEITHFVASESQFSAHTLALIVYVTTLNFIWLGWDRWRRH